SIDVSGWGNDPEAQAIDLAHGLLENLLPPIAWLAGEPLSPEPVVAVTQQRRSWEAFVGRAWVIAATEDPSDAPGLANKIQVLFAAPQATTDRVAALFGRVDAGSGPHWLKVFLYAAPQGLGGRIDLDNRFSWDGASLADRVQWPTVRGLLFVRQ